MGVFSIGGCIQHMWVCSTYAGVFSTCGRVVYKWVYSANVGVVTWLQVSKNEVTVVFTVTVMNYSLLFHFW